MLHTCTCYRLRFARAEPLLRHAIFLPREPGTSRIGRVFWVRPPALLGPVPLATSSGVRSTDSPEAGVPQRPGVLQASASRRILRLYSTVNRRRLALATTSPLPVLGRAHRPPILGRDIKLHGGLIHICREGGVYSTLLIGPEVEVFSKP